MFSTPSIRIRTNENTDSVMRKPNVASARKAFQDRSVNSTVSKILGNTPLQKSRCNLFASLNTPEVKVSPKEEDNEWMYSMTIQPPTNEMITIPLEFNSTLFKKNMYVQPPTPPPTPMSDLMSEFENNFEFMALPPSRFTWDDAEIPNFPSCEEHIDVILGKPHANFDY